MCPVQVPLHRDYTEKSDSVVSKYGQNILTLTVKPSAFNKRHSLKKRIICKTDKQGINK